MNLSRTGPSLKVALASPSLPLKVLVPPQPFFTQAHKAFVRPDKGKINTWVTFVQHTKHCSTNCFCKGQVQQNTSCNNEGRFGSYTSYFFSTLYTSTSVLAPSELFIWFFMTIKVALNELIVSKMKILYMGTPHCFTCTDCISRNLRQRLANCTAHIHAVIITWVQK